MNPILRQLQIINNPQSMFDDMLKNNPQFRDFVNANQGKSPDQIARDYGIDPNLLNRFMK